MAASSVTTSLLRWPATATVLTWLKRRSPCAVLRAPRQLSHFQRAAQIYVQAAFLRLAIERGRAMQHRIGRRGQKLILAVRQTEMRSREVAAENPDAARREMLAKRGKIEMQLQGMPQSPLGFAHRRRAHQQIQRFAVLFEKPRREVRADIAGRAGQKDGHVARASYAGVQGLALRRCPAKWNSRRGALSTAWPSISG